MIQRQNIYMLMNRLFSFLRQVLRQFIHNKGFLLAGAVAYYTLLSIVPLSIIALIVLTNFIEEHELIHTLSTYLEMVIPGYAATLTEQARGFIENRKVVGIIGFLGMLFFSSLAFSMLENAMSVIFSRQVSMRRRNIFISAIIPYGYIFLMGLGIVLVSVIVGSIENFENSFLKNQGWDLGGSTGVALHVLGLVGEVLLLTSIYVVMPVVKVKFRYALVGGITATILWEITRRVLIWYYSAISMVNVIYGSIAITVVALLSVEVVVIILLLGAQVIAELERKADEAACQEI